MIIVEGPDGAGKSTLIEQLVDLFDLPVVARLVDKNTQAIVDLRAWTEENLSQGFQAKLFDRHRLISDPIYRLTMPEKQVDWGLYNPLWLRNAFVQFEAIDPVIIYCLPPLAEVKKNLVNDSDNEAVYPHIDKIYAAYLVEALSHRHMSTRIYDYTGQQELSGIATPLKHIGGMIHGALQFHNFTKENS